MNEENKKQIIYRFIVIGIIIACVSSLITGYYYRKLYEENYYMVSGKISEDSQKKVEDLSVVLGDFRKLIDEYYVGEVDEQKIVDETIKGYVNGLGDEYSEYMTKEEWENYQMAALGNYVGIGVYMSQDENGNVVVVSPIEGSPAYEAGIKEGDIIAEVNGENVLGKDTSAVSDMIKGEEGTKVNLVIIRDGQYIPLEIERKTIKVYKVNSKKLDNNIGYLKIPTFDEGCSDEFEVKYNELKSQGVNKLIIDLRNNTGGLVNEALAIADMIVPKDKNMLVTVDSKGNKEYSKSSVDPIVDMEILVLVNEYSASASEILVGCLKDNGLAKVVGKKTYGKGVIQTVLSLTDGSVLKLTTAEYYTPNETKINKVGIEPDIDVDLVDDEANQDEQLNKAIEQLNS